MPYIRLSVTKKLTKEKRDELAAALGEALSVIPGKDGRYLVSDIEDGRNIYMGTEQQEDMVFADVRYHGQYEYGYRNAFAAALTDAVHRVLGTGRDSVWLNITEFRSWGGHGNLKDDDHPEG